MSAGIGRSGMCPVCLQFLKLERFPISSMLHIHFFHSCEIGWRKQLLICQEYESHCQGWSWSEANEACRAQNLGKHSLSGSSTVSTYTALRASASLDFVPWVSQPFTLAPAWSLHFLLETLNSIVNVKKNNVERNKMFGGKKRIMIHHHENFHKEDILICYCHIILRIFT